MAERDWGTEAGPLADDLEREAEMVVASCLCETCVRSVARLRAAAEGLRLLAEVTAAIGDPDELRYHGRGDVADTGGGDDLQALLRRIADAAAGVSAEAGEEPT